MVLLVLKTNVVLSAAEDKHEMRTIRVDKEHMPEARSTQAGQVLRRLLVQTLEGCEVPRFFDKPQDGHMCFDSVLSLSEPVTTCRMPVTSGSQAGS